MKIFKLTEISIDVRHIYRRLYIVLFKKYSVKIHSEIEIKLLTNLLPLFVLLREYSRWIHTAIPTIRPNVAKIANITGIFRVLLKNINFQYDVIIISYDSLNYLSKNLQQYSYSSSPQQYVADGSNSGKGQTKVPKTVPLPKSSLFVHVLPPFWN